VALKRFGRRQRLLSGLNVFVMVTTAAAVLFGVWYLASLPRFRVRIDLTKEHSFTLTPRTKEILSALDKDVDVTLIFEERNDFKGLGAAVRKVGDYALDLLKEYEVRSGGRVRVQNLDRVRDNLKVEKILADLGSRQVNIVIVRCGKNRKVLIPEDLAEIDQGSLNPRTGVVKRAEVVSYKAEAALTAALIEVTEGEKPVACVLAGRGESQISDRDYSGISTAVTGLRNNNFDVREINLAVGGVIPGDCDVLIIAGPVDDYGKEEMAKIEHYLQKGGHLFLALNPYSCKSFDGKILPAYGVAFDRSLTCRDIPDIEGGRDPKNKMKLLVGDLNEKARITRPLAQNGFRTVFVRAGALSPAGSPANLSIEWLARSPPGVWGDVHPPGKFGDFTYDSQTEKRGMRLLALDCEGRGDFKGSRLVLFAGSWFFTNNGLATSRGNYLLFLNAVNWLASRQVQLAIGPKTPFESRVELFPDEYHRIGFYIMVIIPGAAALLGLVVWWFRRR